MDNSPKQIGIRFGAFAPKISDQLKSQGFHLPKKSIGKYQKIHDALIMLRLHSVIPLSQIQKGEKRCLI